VFLIIRDSCDRTFCEIKKIVNQMTLNGILDCIRSVQYLMKSGLKREENVTAQI